MPDAQFTSGATPIPNLYASTFVIPDGLANEAYALQVDGEAGMIATDERFTVLSRRLCSRRQYVMIFHANSSGLAKRIELWANSSSEALELALADECQRTVDVWEGGDFLCRVSRSNRECDEKGLSAHVE